MEFRNVKVAKREAKELDCANLIEEGGSLSTGPSNIFCFQDFFLFFIVEARVDFDP